MQNLNGFNFHVIVAKNAIFADSRNAGEKQEISETTENSFYGIRKPKGQLSEKWGTILSS